MRKVLAIVVAAVGVMILQASPALAHVVISDNSGQIGAVLHITPDDDPVAGEPSELFFDIQSQSFLKHAHNTHLQIVNEAGEATSVPTTMRGSSVAAKYVFATRGVYKIILTANAEGAATEHAHVFEHTQRVSRGVGKAAAQPTYAWADALVIGAIVSFSVLVIVGYNRRKQIAAYSKW